MKQKCILIFDDDPEILLVCKLILEELNYRVETRANCTNVIEDIGKLKPGLVLMDLWIPDIGGENAIHLIRNNISIRHIPVIIFSANAEIEEIQQRLQANGFLKKPFDISQFTQIIESHILKDDFPASL